MKLLGAILIPQDKANHAIDGAVIYFFTAVIFRALGLPNHREWALAVTTLVGAAKEGADWVLNLLARRKGLPPPHSVEGLDFIATFLGGALCYASGSLE